jgi:hypothetical protein
MILYKHYADPFKLRQLMDLGDLSSLGERIGTQHAFDQAPEGECTFYKRDRKENGVAQKMYENFEDYKANHQYEEYEYILRQDGVWYVTDHNDIYQPLADALAEELIAEAMKEEETL